MNHGISHTQHQTFVAQANPFVRAAFIRQVYGLLFGSLVLTVFSGFFCTQETMLPLIVDMYPMLIIGEIVCMLILSFTRRTTGINLFIFAIFAALLGAVLGPRLLMLSRSAPGLPMTAAAITLGVFGFLTLYVFISRKDFSFMGGVLFVGLIGLLISGIMLAFFPVSGLSVLYSLCGVMIFSGYVLYDTSMIMNRLQPGQAIVGAIELYLDLVNLFLFILRLLSGRRD